jgi:Na+-transporting NADH:ubiquinone oxidoreductase subunit B
MTVDGFSGATPLADLATNIPVDMSMIGSFFNGTIPGSVGETSTFAILIGATILIFTGIGSWRTMLSVFIGGYIMSLLFNLWGTNELMLLPAHLHLILGGFAFGAVFMATDPVTAAQTNKGKYIVGFLIGVFAIIIRVFNPAYPEGMMMAILLLNIFAPLVDHYVIAANIKRRLKRIKT